MQMNEKNFLFQKQLCDEKISKQRKTHTFLVLPSSCKTRQGEPQSRSLKLVVFYKIAKLFSQKTKSASFPNSKKNITFLPLYHLPFVLLYLPTSGVAFWIFALYFVVCNKQNSLNIFTTIFFI